jgi:hypothetical protein
MLLCRLTVLNFSVSREGRGTDLRCFNTCSACGAVSSKLFVVVAAAAAAAAAVAAVAAVGKYKCDCGCGDDALPLIMHRYKSECTSSSSARNAAFTIPPTACKGVKSLLQYFLKATATAVAAFCDVGIFDVAMIRIELAAFCLLVLLPR